MPSVIFSRQSKHFISLSFVAKFNLLIFKAKNVRLDASNNQSIVYFCESFLFCNFTNNAKHTRF